MRRRGDEETKTVRMNSNLPIIEGRRQQFEVRRLLWHRVSGFKFKDKKRVGRVSAALLKDEGGSAKREGSCGAEFQVSGFRFQVQRQKDRRLSAFITRCA
jgi:hypothetical protein